MWLFGVRAHAYRCDHDEDVCDYDEDMCSVTQGYAICVDKGVCDKDNCNYYTMDMVILRIGIVMKTVDLGIIDYGKLHKISFLTRNKVAGSLDIPFSLMFAS